MNPYRKAVVGSAPPAIGVSLCQGAAVHRFPIKGLVIFAFGENTGAGLLITHSPQTSVVASQEMNQVAENGHFPLGEVFSAFNSFSKAPTS